MSMSHLQGRVIRRVHHVWTQRLLAEEEISHIIEIAIISDGGFTDKIRITNMRRRGGQMLEDHLNPRELEGSMEVKKSEEEVFKPAGNRHH